MKLLHPIPQNTMESPSDITELSKMGHSLSNMMLDFLTNSGCQQFTQSILSRIESYIVTLEYCLMKLPGGGNPTSIGSEFMDANAGHSFPR